MRNTLVTLLITLFMGTCLTAQVKIGDNPQNIDPSSVLELESTDKVLVITRVTTAQMNAIVPGQGALCYNTELQAVHYYDGLQWVNIGGGGTGTGGPLTADPIINDVSTIVITPNGNGDNLEVAPNSISSAQIIDGGVNGIDIQDGSIGPGKLQNNSVTEDKLSENSVGAFALDNDNIGVSAFNNDVGYITAGDLNSSVSGDSNNSITTGSDGGAYYDDTNLMIDIMDNTAAIALDDDQSSANEIQSPELNGTVLGLSLTGGTVDLGPLISAGGSDNQNLESATLDGLNILTIAIEDGNATTVDLSSLAGGGGTDDQNLTLNGNIIEIEDGNTIDLTPILGSGGNQNLGQVLAQGTDGGAALIKNILDPVDPQDAATRAYVDAAVTSGGSLLDGTVLIGGTGDVAQQLAISGDATLANNGTLTIIDGAITATKLNDMGATLDGDRIVWNTALNAGAGGWEIAAAGTGSGEANTTSNAGTGGVGIVLPKSGVDLPFKAINSGPSGIISVTDDTAENEIEIDIAAALALPTPADQMLITNGTTNQVEWAPAGAHSGTPMSIFYADATTGLPTTAFNPNNGDISTAPSLVWDPTKRINSGALGIGLDGGPQSDVAKVHIMEGSPADIDFPLQIQKRSGVNAGKAVGVLYAVEAAGNFGKGSVAFERTGAWGVGDFHFLQNIAATTAIPTLADKSFTIKSNKDIVLYGGIDVDGTGTATGLGTAGQVLSSLGIGNGLEWVNAGTATTDTDAADGLSDFTAGSGYDIKVDGTTIEIDTDALRITPGVIDPVNPVEQILSTTTAGVVGWRDIPSGGSIPTGTSGSIFFSDGAGGLVEDAGQISFDDTNDRLNIGAPFATNQQKLNVNGNARATAFLGAVNGANPAFRFFDDADTGMYSQGVDQLTLKAGDQDILTVRETLGNGNEITANGALELEEELIDINGNAGNSGQVLTSTGVGIAWSEPVIFSMGKINPAGVDNINGAGLTGMAGNYTITFANARPDADYIIQLTVWGDNRIFVTNQTAAGFEISILDDAGNPVTTPLPIWYYTVSDF